MSPGGLGGRAAHLLEQMKNMPCKRCGLQFDPDKEPKCPRCADLNDAEVEAILAAREREHVGNSMLGMRFIAAALVIFLILFASLL